MPKRPTPVPKAVLLMGPTASGKTGLAVKLVQRFPLDIISVDSVMVYRGLDIGSAKPDAKTLETAPHRLIDIREPTQPYSAAQFRDDALREMADITRDRRVPLLTGGTMLYFRGLRRGLAILPDADPELRARIDARIESEGLAAVHAELARVDPDAAGRIHPNDPQRIQRALEVFELTGVPLSRLQEAGEQVGLDYDCLTLVVAPADREALRARIRQRFHQMLDAGLVDEVRHLKERGDLDSGLPAIRAVGYRQIWQYLEGETDETGMIEAAVTATAQLAKRQLTWLRAETDAVWFDTDDPGTQQRLSARVEEFLD